MHYSNIPSNYSNLAPITLTKPGQIYIANRGLQHINCILPSQNNKGALFLGDVVCLLKSDLLEKHQIKSILSCMVEPISQGYSNITNHKILPIRDTIQFPIYQYFKEAKSFIDQSRKNGKNILVHCHAGVSRSATIVCAYLMLQNNWHHEQALSFIKQKRYRAKPNINFLKQLQKLYLQEIAHIKGNNSINTYLQNSKMVLSQNPSVSALTNRKINQNPILKGNIAKQQKSFKIILQQQVQTHDELLYLQKRQSLKPFQPKVPFSLTKQRSSITSTLKEHSRQNLNMKKGFVMTNQSMFQPQVYSDRNIPFKDQFYSNKSQIHFNKVFGPREIPKSSRINQGDILHGSKVNQSETDGRQSLRIDNRQSQIKGAIIQTPKHNRMQQKNNQNFKSVIISPAQGHAIFNSNPYHVQTPVKQKKIIFQDKLIYTCPKVLGNAQD